jgi:hypothetical protein
MAGLFARAARKIKLYGRLPHSKCQLIHSFQAYIIKFVLLSQLVIISQVAFASSPFRRFIISDKSRGARIQHMGLQRMPLSCLVNKCGFPDEHGVGGFYADLCNLLHKSDAF